MCSQYINFFIIYVVIDLMAVFHALVYYAFLAQF